MPRIVVTFEQWMAAVDRIVAANAGVSVYDLPDCPYRDYYDDGDSPRQAAGRAIRSAKDEE